MKREGIDPRVKKRATVQGSKTFKEFAEEQYPVWCQGLSEEELKQWRRSVRDVPSLHDKKLQEITTEHVWRRSRRSGPSSRSQRHGRASGSSG